MILHYRVRVWTPGVLYAARHRPEDVVEDEVADLVAERLPGILVMAEVLARVDAAPMRLTAASSAASEKLWKLRTTPGRLGFVREKSRRSVPKKSRRVVAADWLISA